MGLTVHYTLKSKLQSDAEVRGTIEKLRGLALDLPFEHVGAIIEVAGRDCEFEHRRAELQNGDEKNESLFWLLIQASKHVRCPWEKTSSYGVSPTRIIAFDAWPGPGSESSNFGLCLYPETIEVQGRKIPVKLPGWHWESFCKTQYASDPKCGGVPNFLRCHISLITLLERANRLPGLSVRLDDEGKYGVSTYSDDYEEAYAAGRKPTYTRHKGLHSPARLAEEVGEWNTMIAGFAGAMSDALAGTGLTLESSIKKFQNFEQLEFKSAKSKHLGTFLNGID